jgi:hypothetical protein
MAMKSTTAPAPRSATSAHGCSLMNSNEMSNEPGTVRKRYSQTMTAASVKKIFWTRNPPIMPANVAEAITVVSITNMTIVPRFAGRTKFNATHAAYAANTWRKRTSPGYAYMRIAYHAYAVAVVFTVSATIPATMYSVEMVVIVSQSRSNQPRISHPSRVASAPAATTNATMTTIRRIG